MRAVALTIFLTGAFAALACQGCGQITGAEFAYAASPRVMVHTPASPAGGNITVAFHLIDREKELGNVTVEYSTDGGQTFSAATLVNPGGTANLESAWFPGEMHQVEWNSVSDGLAISGDVNVNLKVTPSDASNPSGEAGLSGTFRINNTAYNQPPGATVATPAGVQTGNVQINYFLADTESDTCSVAVQFSADGGANWNTATMGPAGDGITGLSSSPSGTAHVFLWNSRADNIAPAGQLDTAVIRITPTDFHEGAAGESNAFSVDNSITNSPPTVAITDGPANGSTVYETEVTFTWSGSDTDGTVIGYYCSFDHDPPNIWTTDTSAMSGALSLGGHIFRVVAVDDNYDLSAVASRTFTVAEPGTIQANFIGSPTYGVVPVTVYFTDQSTATHGIDSWSWNFGDGGTSTSRDPVHTYDSVGSFTVSLTVSGPDGSDTETKSSYITVTSGGSGPNASELECFNIVNDERQTAGVSPLEWCDLLYNCAKAHACDMCDRGYFSHNNPEGEDPTERGRLGHAGSYTFPSCVPDPYLGIGENIAMGQSSAEEVMNGWMGSSGHRANILNGGYTHIGIGLCTGCAKHWVQNFGTRSGSPPPGTFRFDPDSANCSPGSTINFNLLNGTPPYTFGYAYPTDIQSYSNPSDIVYTFDTNTGAGSYTIGPNNNCTDVLTATDANSAVCTLTISVSSGKG